MKVIKPTFHVHFMERGTIHLGILIDFVEDDFLFAFKILNHSPNRLPKKAIQRWGFNNIDVYVTGYNLFTWTKYTRAGPRGKD